MAVALGEDANAIRKLAVQDNLSLETGGEPAAWHFDAEADEVLFVAEPFNTFYTDWNAYRLVIGVDPVKGKKKNKKKKKKKKKRKNKNKGGSKNGSMAVTRGRSPAYAGADLPFAESLNLEEEPRGMFILWPVANEPDADYWWWDYLYGSYKLQLDAELNIPDPALYGTAQLRIVMRGATDLYEGDDHHVYAELNGISQRPQNSQLLEGQWVVSWDGKRESTLIIDIDQAQLNPNGVNTLTLQSVHEHGTYPVQFLDRIEVNYDRMPVAPESEGMLWLRQVSSGMQRVTGFGDDDIVVVEDPAGNAVLREDVRVESLGIDWSVSFEAVAGKDYLVAERSQIQMPVVEIDHVSEPSKAKNRADYLIIAPRTFAGTAEQLAELRRSRFSRVEIAWLEEIYDGFSFGREDPAAITRFIKAKTGNGRRSPLFVLPIGKASLDHKDRLGLGDGHLPTAMTSTPWTLSP